MKHVILLEGKMAFAVHEGRQIVN